MNSKFKFDYKVCLRKLKGESVFFYVQCPMKIFTTNQGLLHNSPNMATKKSLNGWILKSPVDVLQKCNNQNINRYINESFIIFRVKSHWRTI